ncbi:type II toxin-antitoxin system HipA family toxin [Rahnella sikkimica]|uniref:Toxin HipA n=1 Tax=Rahnella sikkimica TaxID=1805933 RepID=A0A2L1UTI2_9GAMM|nr:HipA domain-containing protein [Rahnella sikkimica]AVF36272.1 toxin HipA [Rahnella sikkimica]
MTVRIAVYADWEPLVAPLRLGFLNVHQAAGREVFSWEFDHQALAHPDLANLQLDPRIGLFTGPQYPSQGQHIFGAFADTSPDRWGRLLMKRRLEREKRAGVAMATRRLHESDYLLGVHDNYRIGALRFRLNDEGHFLDDRHDVAAPPFIQIRELEAASLALEKDSENLAAGADEWLRLLIAPGGSLGGARPKASVCAPDGHLWIAKFPSINDEYNVGAWELVVNTLAKACGLNVPESLARRYANPHHCFLVKRFDRTLQGKRRHFASAMTLTGHQDGADASTGASYLELAAVLINQGAQPNRDLRELWSRIVFNLLVSNTDDHLRNHGFLLEPGKGWRLSPAYDMNPVAQSAGLKLNISEADNAMDLDLALSVAPLFRVSNSDAQEIIRHCQQIVRQWPTLASKIGVSSREQNAMSSAFRLA